MRFTLGEIRWMRKGLLSLSQNNLSIKVSYKISKLLNFCNSELEAVENARVTLVKKLSNGPNDKGVIEVPKDKEEEFKEEFSNLLQEEVDFDFSPIKLSQFRDDIRISPIEMASLSKIIIDDEV